MQWNEKIIDSLNYCIGNEVFMYLVVDLSQASTPTKESFRYARG